MEDSTIYTPEEVAAELKIAKNTVYELIKRGELPAYKVGRQVRIDGSDLELYKQKGKQQSSGYSLGNDMNLQRSQPSSTDDIIISGQDTLLDILANNIQKHPQGTTILRSYVGSFSGLVNLYYDRCHIAATHLLDFEAKSYNVGYVKKLVPGIPCIIIHLAKRKQGFYVKKGNPKKITNWEHLGRSDVSMINREKGSGTRVLLDQHLKSLLISPNDVHGYYNEETSHLEVANNVANGGADVGVGCENAVKLMKYIEFVPLQEESYDIVIKKENLSNPIYKLIY
jgi:putative molybdopterin biosynthesis protein